MLRCDDPTCTCQPAPPKPNRQIQLTLHDSSTSNTIAIHHADADLDIAFDIINIRLVLQETIYRVLPHTPSSTSGGGREINTSRTPLPKRPVSWTFSMNFPISTTRNTKNGTKSNTQNSIKNKSKSKINSNSNSSGGTTLHFANLIGLNDNSLLLTLTLQTTPSETGAGPSKKATSKSVSTSLFCMPNNIINTNIINTNNNNSISINRRRARGEKYKCKSSSPQKDSTAGEQSLSS
ncbi:uncharacterized protein BDW47DRAFT_129147 [Aspergillus candidus]|uniref:Uncharacterized protein n=1 Tax=Aspergillus candidus TaxID=41067 RepID=A0A2I2F119_ASPCN|nr:hypothetical protein BDW47DRAFT_129147 [Aspergillus candidus]PLB34332.1 hypothetical protein BDW47DRAFT_129147 [Aspergillus candidus]